MENSFVKGSKRSYLIVAIIAGILIIAALAVMSIDSAPDDRRMKVVASFYPIWFFSSEIGGDRANVQMLIPDNSEPHSWEPSPSDLIKVREAKMFVYNGAGFEPWATAFIGQIASPDVVIADTSRNITQIIVGGNQEDPHFWLDPLSAEIQVENILEGYLKADPGNSSYYKQNALNLKLRLIKLNDDFLAGLENRTKNAIVTTHEGFGYMAHRYGFDAYGAVGISADQQPSAQDLAFLTQKINVLSLHHVFAEPIYSDALIDTIAQETEAQVLILDGIHGRTGIHADLNYFEMMYANLQNLKMGLEVAI